MTDHHALIIGGGIAGPALALFLGKAGIRATVFEAYPRCEEIGGALGLAPNGMNVLDELGLAEAVIAAGTVMQRTTFRTAAGRTIASTPDVGHRFGRPGVTLSRARVHRIIVDAAAAAGIPVHYGKRLVDISQDETGVTATFADGSQARGDFLVGADGINSRVRQLTLPEAPAPAFTGLIGTGGFVPLNAIPSRVDDDGCSLVLYVGASAFFGYGFGDRDEAMGGFWWTSLARATPMSEAERAALTLDDVRRHVLSATPDWDPAVRAIIDATVKFVPPLNDFDVATLPRWWQGRAVLIGDAAHAVSPHSGQGASLALEDALILARFLRDRADVAEAFAGFEAARRERVERIVAFGRQSGNGKKAQGPIGTWLMRMLMPLIVRMVGRMQKTAFGYRARWDDSAEDKQAA